MRSSPAVPYLVYPFDRAALYVGCCWLFFGQTQFPRLKILSLRRQLAFPLLLFIACVVSEVWDFGTISDAF
jgi:hypothetical protein